MNNLLSSKSLCKLSVFFCPTVTKTEEVKIIMVKHYRIGLDEKYEVTKKWSLNDLQMIDGKEADTVSVMFCKGDVGSICQKSLCSISSFIFLACTKC